MSHFLTVCLFGLSYGVLYSLVAAGLAVTYRTSRMLNFAQGDVVTLGGFLVFAVSVSAGLPIVIGGLVCLVGTVCIGAIFGLVLVPLLKEKQPNGFTLRGIYGEKSHVNIAIGTLGVGLVIEAIEQNLFGVNPVTTPYLINMSNLHIGGVEIGGSTIVILIFGVVILGSLGYVMGRTKIGRRMAATFDNPVGAEIVGIDVRSVYVLSWVIGGLLSGFAAIFAVPLIYLSPTTLVEFMFTAFAAVVVGGLDNITGVVIGGCLFGILDSCVGAYLTPAWEPFVVLVIMLAVLLVRPTGIVSSRRAVVRV